MGTVTFVLNSIETCRSIQWRNF